MAEVCTKSLYEAFGEVPDPRSPLGRQYPLPALLTMAVVAMISGGRGLSAIAQWGRDHAELAPLLGFTRRKKTPKEWKQKPKLKLPCIGTFHYLFKAIDIQAFEAVLTKWLLAQSQADTAQSVVNIDGKTLRGSRQGALPGVHLVAAYAPHLGTAVAQLQVDCKTNEHKAALQLLKIIRLESALVTGDAAFTQRDLCAEIIEQKGDYFFTVKDNQPTLNQNILDAFAAPVSPQEKVTRQENVQLAESHDKYGGRVEFRKIETLAELPPYLSWPGLKQICRIERERTVNGITSKEIVCAITSLERKQASAARLLRIARQHWHIENRLHYVRDVSLGEDACRVRSGSAPQLLAGMRNVVIKIIRDSGAKYIPRALQHFAAKPLEALALMLPEF